MMRIRRRRRRKLMKRGLGKQKGGYARGRRK